MHADVRLTAVCSHSMRTHRCKRVLMCVCVCVFVCAPVLCGSVGVGVGAAWGVGLGRGGGGGCGCVGWGVVTHGTRAFLPWI